MAVLWERTVFSPSSKSWNSAGLSTLSSTAVGWSALAWLSMGLSAVRDAAGVSLMHCTWHVSVSPPLYSFHPPTRATNTTAYGSQALWTMVIPISNSADGMYTPFTYCGEKADVSDMMTACVG
jgi:hypothetical protein